MASAFERHGLDHLSASSINLFAAQPAMWAMQKLMGRRSMVGPAAHRGTAIEAGVEMDLFEPSAPVEACQEAAIARFNHLTALSADRAVEKERANIAPAVAIALAELRQYGVSEAAGENRQHRIEVQLLGVPVPFIGWLDFWFPVHGIIVDLKTQLRLSSKISDRHARQGAIYHAAHGNAEIRFAYVTPQKMGVYRLEDPRRHLDRVVNIAQSIERFLSLSDDGAELTRSLSPDLDSFYWNDPGARAAADEIWGFAPEGDAACLNAAQ
jgi:hypothetical protein